MAPGDRSGRDRHDEVVQVGGGSARGRWLSRLALVCLMAGAVAALVLHAGDHGQPAAKTPAPPPVRVTTVGQPLLGVTAGWQLVARGPDDLVRIQLAQGRITRTYVPPLESGNPDVSLLIGAHETVIRSADFVPGYVVPDGGQARELSGPLAGGGPLLPGPGAGQAAWVTAGAPTSPVLSLVSLTGQRSGTHIIFPSAAAELPAAAVADGRGYVLVETDSFQVYDAGPGWNRAIPGVVAAVGPVNWLVVVCDAKYRHCRDEVIDSATGARRVLPGAAPPDGFFSAWPPPGVISPDGGTAALPEAGRHGQMTLHLINLRTGADRVLGVSMSTAGGDGVPPGLDSNSQSMVWSPDGRWLFVAAAGGRLVVVDAVSGRVQSLGVALPKVTQVAIRAQAGAAS